MTKKIILLVLCSLLLATCSTVQAQQVTKIPRIGIVTGIATDPSSRIKIFRQALQDLGYFEGKNILFEYRNNEGDRSRVPGIVAELVRLKVDIFSPHRRLSSAKPSRRPKRFPLSWRLLRIRSIWSGQ